MSKPARLQDLTHAQIGALLLASRGVMRRASRGWYVDGQNGHIQPATFLRMVELGLFRFRSTASGRRITGDLTLDGYTLADLAITVSREIAAGLAGRPQNMIFAAVQPRVVETEPA